MGTLSPPQTNRLVPQATKLKVFISYSRDDLKFADQLDAALDLYGFECTLDRQGIAGGEDWKRRLGGLIRDAETILFVLSPTSARSEICGWEVEEALRFGKRILPVLCRPLEGASPPLQLQELNYVYFYDEPRSPGSGFGTGLARLVATLNTDLDWLREHTRYLQRAAEWDEGGRPANRLLSGSDITEAKAWAARRPKDAPEPTALHFDFIRASEEEEAARSSAQRKQLEAMAASQTEREEALKKAEEALKQTAEAQHKRARFRNIALVTGIMTAFAVWQWRQAEVQRMEVEFQRAQANEQKELAEEILEDATKLILGLSGRLEFDRDTYDDVRSVFESGAALGDAVAMRNLGLLYANGQGVAQDYAKAREWYEKAAAKDDETAMNNLGMLFHNGHGVAQDYAKAREWYEKAIAGGNEDAKSALEKLPIDEAAAEGRYDEALKQQVALTSKIEKAETKRDGIPGIETAAHLGTEAWYALFTRDFVNALSAAERAHGLTPDDLMIETNRAHALMFLGRGEEAKALYLAHKGKPISAVDSKPWERVIAGDFAEFRKASLTHPMMIDIERELGVTP